MVSKSKSKPKKVFSKVKKVSKKSNKDKAFSKIKKDIKKKGLTLSEVIEFQPSDNEKFLQDKISHLEEVINLIKYENDKLKKECENESVRFELPVEMEEDFIPPEISNMFQSFSKKIYESILKSLRDYKHESIDITGSQYLHGALESLRQLKYLAISFDRELQATRKSGEELEGFTLPGMLFRIEEGVAGIINFIRYSIQNSKHYKNDEHLSNFLYLLNKYEQDALLEEVKNGK
jgi:hypothetical protein